MSTTTRGLLLWARLLSPCSRPTGTPGSTTSLGMATTVSDPAHLSPAEPEVVAVWDSCRFVKMGWFSSREAVTYIDLFFKNMAPLSPILSNFYSHHRNHYWLITQEPVLCCTILMISSRYHTLPGVGGASRGFFIHQRLWQHCQHLIMRVMLGQEKGSKAKTRTVGTIEALLLMSEWHPRSLHFPPESDGWDSDLMMTSPDHITSAISPDMSVSAPNRWLEDVIEPARRSDRMSWMLLGSGLTLAHELGIFDADDSRARSMISSPEMESQGVDINLRRYRIQQLLYVFINQLASRLGCMSLMPQSLNHAVLAPFSQPALQMGDEWHSFMNSWIELTKLSKSVTDMFFPSASLTRQQFHSGRYIGLLDHFRPLLSQWRQKHLDTRPLRSSSLDDIHLGSRYATLLESLITRLRRSFVLSNKRTSRGTTRPSSVRPPADLHSSAGQPDVGHMTGNGGGQMEISNPVFDDQILSLNDINADDWLSLPFDPSMAPFGDGVRIAQNIATIKMIRALSLSRMMSKSAQSTVMDGDTGCGCFAGSPPFEPWSRLSSKLEDLRRAQWANFLQPSPSSFPLAATFEPLVSAAKSGLHKYNHDWVEPRQPVSTLLRSLCYPTKFLPCLQSTFIL
ncbi:hypothetical protein CIHG_00365 [Coccidioides immitis H538.4]|uniref:C6 transcription factor n=1 Tax=Coccidioides immitis H538.4 TaxID=396776 RepID=A0A0J8RF47_COCIT|nr:hypothetical protein CIHG_00365 [Coccidioides immitis H538.4]